MTTEAQICKKYPKISSPIFVYFERNEVGDAELFTDIFGGITAYDHSDRKWYVWEVPYWREDKTGRVNIAMTKIANIYMEFSKASDMSVEGKDALLVRYRNLLSKTRIKNVLTLATHQPSIRLTGNEWNINPMWLPVENGIVDLSSGEMKTGTSSDYINVFVPTKWSGLDTPCPIWERFIADICNDNLEMISFIQRLLGYAITGDTREQVMPILWGEGSNGKSILMDTIRKVLGSAFCYPTQADSLMDTRNNHGEGPRPFVVGLRNKRLVWASESQDGQRLNTGLVKQLTGDQNITARTLYKEPITFSPSHKIFLVTNSLPNLPDGGDYALLRRLFVLPFNVRFVDNPTQQNERKRDKNLQKILETERSGILAWLVRGAISWNEHGLNVPDVCQMATNYYRESEDVLGQFIQESLSIADSCEVVVRDLYLHYLAWCQNNGHEAYPKKIFGHKMIGRFGASRVRNRNGRSYRVYEGIGIITNNILPYPLHKKAEK